MDKQAKKYYEHIVGEGSVVNLMACGSNLSHTFSRIENGGQRVVDKVSQTKAWVDRQYLPDALWDMNSSVVWELDTSLEEVSNVLPVLFNWHFSKLHDEGSWTYITITRIKKKFPENIQ